MSCGLMSGGLKSYDRDKLYNIKKCSKLDLMIPRLIRVSTRVIDTEQSTEYTCVCTFLISMHGYVKPASDYKLIRRFRLSRRCRSSCRDFRLATGMLRLSDYLRRARSD